MRAAALVLIVAAQAGATWSLHAQQRRLPLAPVLPKGDEVAPFFEGWYRNDDGTFTLSFGFFNLNSQQVLDIPLGPDNFIEPAEFDGAQPTHFPVRPRRDRGVFHVTVPASYEDGEQAVVRQSLRMDGPTRPRGAWETRRSSSTTAPGPWDRCRQLCASAPTDRRASTFRACGPSRAPQPWASRSR